MADSSQHGSSQASSSGRLSWPMRTSPPGSGSVGSDSSTSRAWSRRKTMGASLGGRQLSKKASLEKLQTYGSCIAWFEEDNSQWPATLDDYELQEVCGKGASATVFRAERKSDGYVVAIKRIDLELFGENMDIVMREAMIMRQQRHGHVLPLFTAFLHEHSLHMVMPYVAGGAVTQIMAKCCPQGFTPTVVATIAKAVLEGLAYLHQRGCIHRDVKAENVLIEGSGHVVLADFGVTAVMEQAESNPKANRRSREVVCRDSASSHEGADSAKKHHCYLARHTFVGTPSHMAPEIMEQDAGYYESADIWAFGMLLIELARGRAPYANFSLTNIIMMTLHSDPPELDSDCHCEPLREVVAQCLVHEPGERPTAAKLLKHRFFKMAKDDTWLKEELFRNVESVAPYYNGSMHGGLRKSSSASFFSKSLNYTNSHATLLRDASRAASTLRNACSRKRSPELRMKPESLLTCEAVAFVQVLPMRNHDAGFGHGFLCTKLEDGQGNISWSAPVFFDLIIPGATAEFRHIECCFVIPDGPSLQAFVQARPILGTGAPVSRDVELGLASRRQILRQLDRTLLGNLQVAPGASSSDPSMHSRHHSSTTLMEAFNNLPPPDSVPKPVQDGLYQEGNVSAQAASKHTPTDGAAAGNSPPSILSGSVAASAGTAKGYQVPFSPFGAPAPQQAAPLPALATSENSSTVGSSSIHDWSPTCKMPMQASIPELAEQGYSGPVVVTEQGQDTPEGLILGAQVSGTVTLPEVPPPAEVAVEAGVAAARGGQQPPDQQKGQLQGQAAADVPEGQGQQQLQAQVVSDTPEQPALQQQQQQQQQQSPPQGAAGALQRRWDRLKCGPLGHGKSERANTLKPLQRQASAEALTTPQRQASAETLQPLQRQASADTLKPLPSSSDRGQWQATSNFQAPLQRQRSAGHTRKVSMDGSGRPPKSPTVGSLQSPQRAPAPPGAQGPALKRTASAHDMHGRLPAAALAKPGPVRRRRKFPDRTKSGSLEDAPPPQQLPIMYAYGVAEPYLMNCPCKMSLKYACVTMNSDYNNRLYGGRMLGTILAGNVPVPPAMNSFHTALNRIFEKGRDPEKQKAWYLRVLHSIV